VHLVSAVELLTRQALARIDQNAVILWVIDLHGRGELSETGSRDCVDKSDAFDKRCAHQIGRKRFRSSTSIKSEAVGRRESCSTGVFVQPVSVEAPLSLSCPQ
jgi:hypothetical protein